MFAWVCSGRPTGADAHEVAAQDFNVVTRDLQNNNTQRWLVRDAGTNVVTIQQLSNGCYPDAHEVATEQFRVVTRKKQNNDTQRWRLIGFGGGFFKIQQARQMDGRKRRSRMSAQVKGGLVAVL